MTRSLFVVSLLAASSGCVSPTASEDITIEITSVAPSGEVSFQIINHSGTLLCSSAWTSGPNVQENVFKFHSVSHPPLEIVKSGSSTAGEPNFIPPKEIELPSGLAKFAQANIFDYFYFQRVGTYQFDVSLPVFPCGDHEVAMITREWEDEFGPRYLHGRGVRFPTSRRYNFSVSNLELQRRRSE